MNKIMLNTIGTPCKAGGGGNSGGGGNGGKELTRNDVNFFDYDGTLLYSYSWEEAKKLTELPEAPSHEDMNFVEWNYTLEDIKAQGFTVFADEGGYYRYVGDLVIDGVTYKAWNHAPNGLDGGWALLVNDPQKGGSYYYAELYDDGWFIDTEDDGTPTEYSILDVDELSGKADIGAVYVDYHDNYIENPPNVLIMPRGTTELSFEYASKAIFTVTSLPNTIEVINDFAFDRVKILNPLIIPTSVKIMQAGYGVIYGGYCSEVYYNGSFGGDGAALHEAHHFVNPVYKYPNILYCDSYYGPIVFWECVHAVIMSKVVNYIPGPFFNFRIENSDSQRIVDFSENIFIPQLNSGAFEFYSEGNKNYSNLIIIVPDALYDTWINSTNWADIASCIMKKSQFEGTYGKINFR